MVGWVTPRSRSCRDRCDPLSRLAPWHSGRTYEGGKYRLEERDQRVSA